MGTSETDSSVLFARARKALAGGISHENRFVAPYPIYVDRAVGSRKWDVSGREYVDFSMGSASQMLGHSHPVVVEAVQQQMMRGVFYANCHPLEVEWAELIQSMVPSAERVRFTASGTEATLLALRVARAHTGKVKVIRFEGHFHGWHDHLLLGMASPYDQVPSLGVLPGSAEATIVCKPAAEAVEGALRNDPNVAAIIVEVSGANWGSVPIPSSFLGELRRIANEYKLVLIFDEVITGFRWSPGGVQAMVGVVPDLTTMAKIVTGGMPGGALAGRENLMELLDPQVKRNGKGPTVMHRGTFNGNPLVSAAAVAAMKVLKTGEPQQHADKIAALARARLQEAMDERQVLGCVYGESSTFQMYFGHRSIENLSAAEIRGVEKPIVIGLQDGLRRRGIDLMSYMGGVTSLAHTEQDVDVLVGAFADTVEEMMANKLLPRQ